MGKNKYKKNRDNDSDEEKFKKKKNVISQELLMNRSDMDFTEFIPMIPEDALYPPFKPSSESVRAVKKMTSDFIYVLYQTPKKFWATVMYNISFTRSVSSCLSQLSCRWMNRYRFTKEEQGEEYEEDFEYRLIKDTEMFQLMDVLVDVFLKVVFRIISWASEDPNLNEIYNFGESLIRKQYVFTFPKLLELIQIYGESNAHIVQHISRTFLSSTLQNPYRYFTDELFGHCLRKLEQCNRQMKVLTDREQFGINYSYKRVGKELSPGQKQLQRKMEFLMSYLSFLRLIENSKFLSEDIRDHCFYNHQVHFVLENMFYEIDAAYKTWNYQGQQERILPAMNEIIVRIRDYFVEYFQRVHERLVLRNAKKVNTIEAYIRSFQRFFKDYGKRNSIGKKANNQRNMTLFKLIQKKFDLLGTLQEIYIDEEANQTYEFNMEYLIDFKLALEDAYHANEHIEGNDEDRQNEIEEETQVPNEDRNEDMEPDLENEGEMSRKQSVDSSYIPTKLSNEKSSKIEYEKPADDSKLEVLVSKKNREDDYYEALYMKQIQKCKIEYEDEYDDLADYDKRPMFMDEPSSDSESESEEKKHRVNNEENQRASQAKHIKFEQKKAPKEKKNPKYQKIVPKGNEPQGREQEQSAKGSKDTSNTGAKKYKQKTEKETNNLMSLAQQERVDQNDYQRSQSDDNGQNQPSRNGGRPQNKHKRRWIPNEGKGNEKGGYEKGKNSNKNREHNQISKDFGGGKKYKAKH